MTRHLGCWVRRVEDAEVGFLVKAERQGSSLAFSQPPKTTSANEGGKNGKEIIPSKYQVCQTHSHSTGGG